MPVSASKRSAVASSGSRPRSWSQVSPWSSTVPLTLSCVLPAPTGGARCRCVPPARGADAVDLYHVATEEQTGFPFEQRAMPPRMPAGEHDLEPAVTELERLTVAKDAVDGKVAAAHRDDAVALGIEREGTGERVPEVVPLTLDRLDPDD